MRRFFTDKKLTVGTEIVLDGEEAKHIMTVLRMKPGDELLLINGTGREMTARILNENKGEVRLEAISDAPCPSEPLNRVTLFQCLPKAGKLELIIQKCVELGIFAIQPVYSKRCVVKPEAKESKLLRFNRVAQEAAKTPNVNQQEVHTTQQTESVSDAMSLLQALSGGTAASEPDPVMPQKAQEVPSETAEPAVMERAETARTVKPVVVDMPAAASTAAAPKYSDDMTVDEILSLMTEEEAAELVVTTGVNKGWTMAQVSEQRPSSLKYYAYLCEDCGNIVKAAAMLLMGGSQQLKAS